MKWSHHTFKLLLVEDDADDIFLTSTALRKIDGLEIKIDTAKDYLEAIVKLTNEKYDIAIFDYFLGDKTGIELYNDIKSNVLLPVILLTGKTTKEIDEIALQVGISDYLEKSEIDSKKLSRSIRYSIEKYNMLLKLKNQELHYRSIFENSSDGIIITDTKGKIQNINAKAKHIFSTFNSNLEYIQDSLEIVHLKNKISKLLHDYSNFRNEEFSVQANGEDIYYSLDGNYQYIDNDFDFCHFIIYDITAIKKSQMILAQSEKQAVTERFMRLLGHEIRNPLTNIYLAINHLQEELLSPYYKPFLDIIDRNSLRINDLLNSLLKNTQSSESILIRIPVDDVLMQAMSNVQDRIRIKNIDVNINIKHKDIFIYGDQEKLIIAFTNILVNATEAVESHKGKINVSLTADTNNAIFIIEDNGIGMNEDQQKTIFEPYVSNKVDGLGLGMAATASILKHHHADIVLYSSLGSGTTFKISIPKV